MNNGLVKRSIFIYITLSVRDQSTLHFSTLSGHLIQYQLDFYEQHAATHYLQSEYVIQ